MKLTLSLQGVGSAQSTVRYKRGLMVLVGGSCGCVVAGRLAALDRNLKVLLIEGGENNLNNPWVPMYVILCRLQRERD